MTVIRHLLLPALAAAYFSGCAADSESSPGPCRADTDCSSGLVCEAGECTQVGCATSDDCTGDRTCVGGFCSATEADAADAGDAASDSSDAADGSGEADAADTTDTTDATDTSAELDAAPDVVDVADEPDVDWGPLSWTVSPAEGANNVALDATIEVRFNQPMNALRFIPANLTLRSYDGATFLREIAYNPDTFVLTLTPGDEGEPLPPATPIYFRMEEFISSASGLSLGDPVTTRFVTTGYSGTAFHEGLAVSYAPVIYQQIERSGIDTFTSFEFDGDSDYTNNLDSAARPIPNPGNVYYSVVETDSHFFITYVLYYAGMQQNPSRDAEHDMFGYQVVVEKVAADPLGRLWAASLLVRSSYTGWALGESWYAGGTVATGDIEARINPAALENARRLPLFVESGLHDACFVGYPSGRCTPTTGADAPFEDDTRGVVYRAGGAAQRVGDGPDASLTYVLLPWMDAVWYRRDQTSGPGAPFGGTQEYYPPFENEATETLRPGAGRYFPATLAYAHDGDSFGELPFTWSRNEAFPPDNGLWFVDPAWLAAEKWELPEGSSTTYCFNPWIGVDARAERATCTAPDFELP